MPAGRDDLARAVVTGRGPHERRQVPGQGAELGIGPLPININEYAHNYHLSVPGQMIQWVSAIEESKVDADLAYWNIDGNLNDSAVEANKGNGQWWLFNAYGQMTGNTVRVTAPHPNVQYTLQGVATLDRGQAAGPRAVRRRGRCRGRRLRGTSTADVFGTTVHATVQEIPWTGQVGRLAQPLRLRDAGTGGRGDGRVILPVTRPDEMSAYQVDPVARRQRSRVAAARDPVAADLRGRGRRATPAPATRRTDPRDRPWTSASSPPRAATTWAACAPVPTACSPSTSTCRRTATYDLSVFANSYNQYDLVREHGPTNVFLRVDGEAPQELRLPLGYKWVGVGPHRHPRAS